MISFLVIKEKELRKDFTVFILQKRFDKYNDIPGFILLI